MTEMKTTVGKAGFGKWDQNFNTGQRICLKSFLPKCILQVFRYMQLIGKVILLCLRNTFFFISKNA